MAEATKPTTVHRLHEILSPPHKIGALILLNGPSLSPNLLNHVWPLEPTVSYPTICADGAANLLHSLNTPRKPSHIVGDLDSITPTALIHYSNLGTQVIRDGDVDTNDFQKSIRTALQTGVRNGTIVVVGGHGGRMDQTLANINSLYTEVEKGVAMMWLDDGHVTFALGRGVHEIHVDLAREGPTCGLLPVGKAVERVSTSGLEWNLDEGEMAFGGLISSSNAFKESVVRVSTSDTILWTHEVRLG